MLMGKFYTPSTYETDIFFFLFVPSCLQVLVFSFNIVEEKQDEQSHVFHRMYHVNEKILNTVETWSWGLIFLLNRSCLKVQFFSPIFVLKSTSYADALLLKVMLLVLFKSDVIGYRPLIDSIVVLYRCSCCQWKRSNFWRCLECRLLVVKKP